MKSKKGGYAVLIGTMLISACSDSKSPGTDGGTASPTSASSVAKTEAAPLRGDRDQSQAKLPQRLDDLKVIYEGYWASENNVLSKYALDCRGESSPSLIRIFNNNSKTTRFAVEELNQNFQELVGTETGDEESLIPDEDFESYAKERGVTFYRDLDAAIKKACESGSTSSAATSATNSSSEAMASQIVGKLRSRTGESRRSFTIDNMAVVFMPDELSGRGGTCVLLLSPDNLLPNREGMAEQITVGRSTANAFYGISVPDITGAAPRMKASASSAVTSLKSYVPGPPKYWVATNGTPEFSTLLAGMKASAKIKVDFGAYSLGQDVVEIDLKHFNDGLSAINTLCPIQ